MNITPVEQDWIRENISKIDFLSVLEPEQINALIEKINPRILQGQEQVIQEGEANNSFFLIYSGKVSVWVERRGKRAKLASLEKGDYFGEISLLTGKPATAQILTNMPSKVFFLDGKHFIEMVKKNENLSSRIIREMKTRLTQRKSTVELLMNEKIDEINSALRDFLEMKK